MSENSGAPKEPGGPAKRRRKRRPRGGPRTGQAGRARQAENGEADGSGKTPVSAVDGSVQSRSTAQDHSVKNGSGDASADKRRRKRKRKMARGAGTSRSEQPAAGDGAGQLEKPDSATSAKGKKAARRRGRRRWQTGNKAGSDGTPANDGTRRGDRSRAAGSGGPGKRGPDANAAVECAQGGFGHKNGSEAPNKGRPSAFRNAGPPLYAALDLGTNNCRLLIARPEDRGFRVVDAYSRIVRLGEGVGSNKRLSDAAMDRAIEALANCHHKLVERGVARSRLIATEACRAAENGMEFIDRVRSETGLALEIVDRETEARLAVAGCASLVDHEADGVILFDIGGGSSEIVWLDLRNRCGARGYALTRFIRSWISLPVGVVNLAERHGGVDVTSDVFEAMVDDAAGHLADFGLADTLTEAIASGGVHMLGTSGTVTTLAGVHLGLKRYDRRRVDGAWLEDDEVSGMIDQLRDMSYEARVENPCIGADRADLVLAGCAILEAIRRRWSCSRLRVADRGLREGILTELMAADGVWSRRKTGRRSGGARRGNKA